MKSAKEMQEYGLDVTETIMGILHNEEDHEFKINNFQCSTLNFQYSMKTTMTTDPIAIGLNIEY